MATNNCINTTYPISVNTGGTGDTTLTIHGVLIGQGTSPISTTVGMTGQVLTGTSGDPNFLSLGTNSGLTAHSVVLSQGSSAFTALGNATNGQLIIGSTGNDPSLATLTPGSGITITNGSGTITIASSVSQGIVTLDGDTGSATGTVVTIAGGHNMSTSATGSTVTLNVSGATNHSVQVGAATGALTSLTVGTTGQVLIGSTGADPSFGALGVNSGLTAHSLVVAEGNSAFVALGAATNGQLPIGSTGADPVLATITAGTGISVTNGAGSITIASTTTGTPITTLDGDTGSATGATVTIMGGNNIATSASGSTVTVNVSGTTNHALQVGNSSGSLTSLGVATNGQLAIGSTGASPVLATLSSSGSTITITNGAGTINLDTGTAVATSFMTGSGTATPASGVLTVPNGSNINTTGSGSTLTINLVNSPSVSGSLTAGTSITATAGAITATAGNVVITAGNLTLPNTNSALTNGVITLGGSVFLSNYGTGNAFLGGSGNGTLTTANAVDNIGLGVQSLISLTTGANNIGIGALSGKSITTGAQNTMVGSGCAIAIVSGSANSIFGYNAGRNVTGGSNTILGAIAGFSLTSGASNILLGDAAGNSYTSSESSNIAIGNSGVVTESNVLRIGTQGSSTAQQNKCFIAGITGVSVTSGQIVTINSSTGQLGTMGAATNGQLNIGSTGATPVLATLTSGSSANISVTNGAGSITLDLIAKPVLPSVYGNTVGGSGIAMYIDSSGNMGTVVSSQRFKERITDMGNRSSRIMDLRPVNFAYKHDESHAIQWGLIAEEVNQVMPELVAFDIMGVPYSVRYQDLTSMLLNELQKLSKRVNELEVKLSKEA
jgi:hypothetical protein